MTIQKQISKKNYLLTITRRLFTTKMLWLYSLFMVSLFNASAATAITSTAPIASPTDDARETMSTGNVDLSSRNLPISFDDNGSGDQRIGLRFALNIPSNSIITNAYIQFTADKASNGATNFYINAEYRNDAAPFASNPLDISSRPVTPSTIHWVPRPWNTVGHNGPAERTPDLSALIQEVINLENWQANNHIAFIIYGSGTRTAKSFDGTLASYGSTDLAPQLHIEYSENSAPEPAPPPADHLPVANTDTLTTAEDTTATLNVLTNDTGLEDGGIVISLSAAPANGTVTIGANGALTYTPASGFSGADTFQYRITDADGDVSSANVDVTVNTSVLAPITVSDDTEERMSTGQVDLTRRNLQLTYDTSVGGQRVGLRFALNIPSNSVITNAYIQFTADKASSSASNLYIFAERNANAAPFSGNDFDVSSRAATASTINWTPPSWNTVGHNGFAERTPDLSPLIQEVIELENWQANNHIAFIMYGSGTRTAKSYDGTLANYGTTDLAPQLHIEYATNSAPAPEPEPTPVDHLPAANADALTTAEDTTATVNVLSNDTGLEDGGIVVTLSAAPANGTVSIGSNGALTYTPNSGYAGSDTFQYRITDADGDVSSANVSVTVIATDHLPVANTDTLTTAEDTTATLNVLTNDTGLEDGGIVVSLSAAPANGTVTIGANGALTYTPASGFSGADTFQYRITDADGDVSSASVGVTVVANEQITILVNEDAEEELSSGTIDLSSSDLELIHEPGGSGAQRVGLQFALNIPSNHHILNAYIQFTTDEVSTGASNLKISAENSTNAVPFSNSRYDLSSRSLTAHSVNWTPANWNTVGEQGLDQRTPDLSTIIQEIIDTDGWQANRPIAFIFDGSGTRNAASLNGAPSNFGSVNFAPQLHIEYAVNSAQTPQPAPAPKSVPTDSLPEAYPDSASTDTATPVAVAVLENDTGLNDGPVTVSITSLPANGVVTVNTNNSVIYTPDSGFFGADSFIYKVTDADSDSAMANVEILVICTSGICTKTIRVTWNPNPEPDIAGYYLYHGTQSSVFPDKIWVGNITTYDFETADLTDHFFVISAVNSAAHESGKSEEIPISLAP